MKNVIPFPFENFPAGTMATVVVSKGGKEGVKTLKVCKIKARSVLFIEVDKVNRTNTFRKFKTKDIELYGKDALTDTIIFYIKEGILPDKWESSWDAIGSYSPSVQKNGNFGKPHYSNHSKGWSAGPKIPHRYLATGVLESTSGFPIV
jgi:hypothetical protein